MIKPMAFPLRSKSKSKFVLDQTGMSLRDYFAGQALVGLLSNDELGLLNSPIIAEMAYKQADAMLKEREK